MQNHAFTSMIRRLLTVILGIGISLSIMSCTSKEHHVTSKNELVVFLDTLEQRYEKACEQIGIANWNSYSGEGPADLDGAKEDFAKLFLDTSARATVDEWRLRSKSLADKLLARRLELWHRCFLGGGIYADPDIAKLENKLQKKIIGFKLTFEGKPATRAQVINRLREEKNQRRRHRLWAVPGQISAATDRDLVRLVKLRNKKAKALGFPTYYSLALHLQAIDEGWLLRTLEFLEQQTRAALQDFIASSKKKFHMREFGPWDYDFVLRETVSLPDKYFPQDSVFDIIHRFEEGIGFAVDSLPIREVVKDIPYNGLSLAIRIPTDSRFLLNPTKGKGFYGVAFHEYGHSLKSVHVSAREPVLKGYEWIPGAQCAAFEEGIADMHGEFTDDSLWLTTFTKVKQKEIERYVKGRRFPALFRLRRLMKDFFFEYEMYKDPDQDLPALERALIEKYLLAPPDKKEPHQFAASMWYTSYPCYYQNYILSAMMATQLQEALTDKFGSSKISDTAVSKWMVRYLYASGETEEWTERMRNATGKALEPGAYLRKLGIEEVQKATTRKEDR